MTTYPEEFEYTIRFQFNKKAANILDLTKPEIAKEWGYLGGEDYTPPRQIAEKAKQAGYNAIRYSSERGKGANLAIFENFESLLTFQKISRAPRDSIPSFIFK